MTHREELEQRDGELLSEIVSVVSSCRTHVALDAEYDGLLAKIARHRQAFALSERNDERKKAAAEIKALHAALSDCQRTLNKCC